MNVILAHSQYEADHLAEVTEEMQQLGAPTIRAFYSELYGAYLAIEGCHRLRAAADLDLVPVIVVVEPEGEITLEVDGCDETVDAAELFAQLQSGASRSTDLDFDE